jgi:predicted nucleotidyltransferase
MEFDKIRLQAKQVLDKAPILKAYLFGSVARGENKPGSDLDILIEIDPARPIGLIEFIKLQLKLEEVLKSKVDLVSSDGISPYLAPFVNMDKILIYEAGTRG